MTFTCRACFFILCVVVFMDHAHARSSIPSWKDIRNALKEVVNEDNGGFGLNQWAVVVDRDNIVQAIVYSGDHRGDQWPGSRQIAAIKACTANSFSLPHFAISTANLYGLSQAGGPLFGIQSSLPPYLDALYKGKPSNWGTSSDPMIGYPIGGVVVFGGGLPLYSKSGELVGGLGVSGDTSCTDHIVAWKLRHLLELDYVPNGFGGKTNVMYGSYDNLGHGSGVSAADHPYCDKREASIVSKLHKGDYAVRT